MSALESVGDVSDAAVSRLAAEDPCAAVILGIPVGDRLTDYSPEGHDSRARTIAEFSRRAVDARVEDSAARVAQDVMLDQFGRWKRAADAGDNLRDVNILSSPPQQVRLCLEFAAPELLEDLLADVPRALSGWRDSLTLGQQQGLLAARRQAVAVAAQLATYAEEWLPSFVESRGVGPSAADQAGQGFRNAATWLSDVYTPSASDEDAVGEERYTRGVAAYNGLELDLDDTYAWGWQEIADLTAELRAEVDRWRPGLLLTEVRAALDADPAYRIQGVDALRSHLEDLTARATERADGVLLDLDPRVRECRVELAAQGAAAAPYYVPPSEDLSRPGTTWYPARGATDFPRWWLESVWFHEGVPGHHLQLGAFAVQDDMDRFQRLMGGTSGHAEGWALYAERLCDEQGWFDEPGTRIGFLSAQLLRAVRVVIDIGLHTDRRIPDGLPGARTRITAQVARRLLVESALLEPSFADSEVDRYLGMPGQAISYKVGERVWLEARDRARNSPDFDLKDWHAHAMRLGPMGLGQFDAEIAAYPSS